MTKASVLKVKNRKDIASENLTQERIQKILANVAGDKVFYFYEDIGRPIGASTVSLSDFCSKINTIPSKSLIFHLKRGDFEKWIEDAVGDSDLSQQISKLKARKTLWKNDASLRTRLHGSVTERITELQDLWHESLKLPQNDTDKPLQTIPSA